MLEGNEKPNISQYSDYMFLGGVDESKDKGFKTVDNIIYQLEDNAPKIDGVILTDENY